ncbi:MAG TPA: hypothetical protein VFV87_11320 [Pirellulaceae bacterium]|nr:hypothetical protein [Pirellulaceae bacterium]
MPIEFLDPLGLCPQAQQAFENLKIALEWEISSPFRLGSQHA